MPLKQDKLNALLEVHDDLEKLIELNTDKQANNGFKK